MSNSADLIFLLIKAEKQPDSNKVSEVNAY